MFGKNEDHEFFTTDVPPVTVKDIKVYDGDRLCCHWPLSRHNGEETFDIVSGRRAVAKNAVWKMDSHYAWNKVLSLHTWSLPMVAYDAATSRIFVAEDDSLYIADLDGEAGMTVVRTNGSPVLDAVNQMVYDRVNDRLLGYSMHSGEMAVYDFSSANIFRKYGENWRQEFADMAHKRLKSWGMNTIANSSDKSICLMDKTVYTDRIEIKSPYIEGSQSGLWWKFRDPYTEEFAESVRTQLEERRNELEDPWCLGFFVDNEIGWGEAHSIGEWTMLSPASQPAKKEMVRRLKEKYRDIARLNSAWTTSFKSWSDLASSQAGLPEAAKPDLCDFSKAVIRKYFSTTREIFKEIAPEKLYLGCRFARSNPDVLRIAAEYCDVLSYNIYKHDLSTFSLPEGIDKPVIIGEFHFGAKDRGPFHPGLINAYSQEQRGEAYERYVESALENAYIIGTHWHQFSDQATTGRFDGENFQVGMTDICDRPYYETIRHVRNIGYRMYAVRSGRDR